jgi:hypothetical protein
MKRSRMRTTVFVSAFQKQGIKIDSSGRDGIHTFAQSLSDLAGR